MVWVPGICRIPVNHNISFVIKLFITSCTGIITSELVINTITYDKNPYKVENYYKNTKFVCFEKTVNKINYYNVRKIKNYLHAYR